MRDLAFVICFALTACATTLPEMKSATDKTGESLKKCRTEARADFYVGGKSVDEALATYEACKKREGL